MTNQVRYFVEEIRTLRRQHARLVAAVQNALDNSPLGTTAHETLKRALEESDDNNS